MREILFRAKRLDNGKWIYGSLLQCVDKQYILEVIAGEVEYYEIDPETVGQYTGVTDKKGTMIFSGDIVKSTVTRGEFSGLTLIQKVMFNDGAFGLYHKCFFPFNIEGLFLEVIGNIHDNPEIFGDE